MVQEMYIRQPSRYRTRFKLSSMSVTMLTCCVVSSMVTAIALISTFILVYHPMVETMEANYIDTINQLNVDWESDMTTMQDTLNEEHTEERLQLESRIVDLESQLETAQSTLNTINEESELEFDTLNEYWYVFKEAEDDSGITTDLIEYVDAVCKEWNVNPHWMWAIYWNESRFTATIDNSAGSGARGLGQVMPYTGEYMWEQTFGNGDGSFQISMLYDPYVNVDITVAIIGQHLSNGWTMYDAINQYSGGGGDSYYNKLIDTAKNIFGIDLNEDATTYPY